mmetsp:Transcript_23442/g.51829  ORF Transcript_23442/g.51829 Transcript_23442/m.51829 type:complete len:295 (+) Transcript_23442:426-1310(+)
MALPCCFEPRIDALVVLTSGRLRSEDFAGGRSYRGCSSGSRDDQRFVHRVQGFHPCHFALLRVLAHPARFGAVGAEACGLLAHTRPVAAGEALPDFLVPTGHTLLVFARAILDIARVARPEAVVLRRAIVVAASFLALQLALVDETVVDLAAVTVSVGPHRIVSAQWILLLLWIDRVRLLFLFRILLVRLLLLLALFFGLVALSILLGVGRHLLRALCSLRAVGTCRSWISEGLVGRARRWPHRATAAAAWAQILADVAQVRVVVAVAAGSCSLTAHATDLHVAVLACSTTDLR